MPGIARVKTDSAGAIIIGPGTSTIKVDGKSVALIGDKVAAHGKAPHTAPTLISNGATTVKMDSGVPAMVGTVASCGHTVTGGSPGVSLT